ncbi:ArfGAP with FG repeats 1 [Actinomortierella ambigua]|nr:ArfGAP with FG repeats 1 [Actinomortierella ambigua]
MSKRIDERHSSREFNHRVKSISASTFSPDEIAALQRGGNGVAKTTWLATWSWQECPEPDSNNNDEVRRFMRAKYVKRLWHVDGNATSATSGTSKDSTPRPSTASSAPRPSNASTSSAQASPSRTPVPSSTSPNIALAKAAVGGTGASISERTLSRKSSTLSTDSGSTNLSRSTDPSSAGSSPFHPTTAVTSGSKPLSTISHQQLPSSNLGQYSFSHFQQTLATTPTGHADSDADPFSLMQSSFANMQMSRDNIQQQRQQQQQQQQVPLPSRSFTAPTPSSNQYGSFADFESAFSSTATPSHPPPMPSVLPGASSSANDFFAAFHSSPSSSSSAPITSTSTSTTTTTNAAMMTSIPRGMTSPSFATTSSSVNGMVASPSMLSPMPMHSANDYFGAGAGAGAGMGAGAGAGMHSLSVGAASGARSFDDFLSSMGGGPSLSLSAHTNAKATISDIGNPFGLGGSNSASALTTQLPTALQRAHTSAHPSVGGGGGGVGGSGGGSTNPFAAFAKSSSSSSTLGSSNLDPLHDVFGHSSRGTNMTMSSSNGISAANPFSATTTGLTQHPSSLSSSSSNTLFQSQHGLLQQAPYHTNGLSTATMTATTSAGSDWASSAFASSTTTTLTGNSAMPAMLTRATTEPTVSHFATGYGGGVGAPVEDMFGSWASKTPSMPNNSQQQQRHNTNSNSGTANAFGVNDFDPFGFHPHNHHHHHQHHPHAASASTNPFGL